MEGNPLNFRWTVTAIGSVIYLALFGSIAGFWLYYWLLRQIQVTKALLICLVVPVVAIILGAVFLNEHLGWQVIAGSFLVLSGVGLILVPSKNDGTETLSSDDDPRKRSWTFRLRRTAGG
jgi:drug/metabolite transporter (DMT)-like permease